ncbi:MAG TPA: hypothetical protein VLA16_15750 [Ideonella sp.]|nr:hypothetical protein [Ideonella sp.]
MISAIWIFTGLGLTLWSLLAWGLYALLSLAPGWACDVKPWLAELPLGEWLERWLPGWQSLAEALIDLMQALLTLLGTLVGGLAPWLVWGVWAVGALLMLGFAAILHAIVRAANRPRLPA